jgi:hypothetical protein
MMRARTAPRQRAARVAVDSPPLRGDAVLNGARRVANAGPDRKAGAGKPPRPRRLPGRKLGPFRAVQVRPGRRTGPARPRHPAHPEAPRRRRLARDRSTPVCRRHFGELERSAPSPGVAFVCSCSSWRSSSTTSAPMPPERAVFEPSPDLRRSSAIGRPEIDTTRPLLQAGPFPPARARHPDQGPFFEVIARITIWVELRQHVTCSAATKTPPSKWSLKSATFSSGGGTTPVVA